MKVVVLNDGETYTSLNGCVVLDVPDDLEGDDVDYFVKNNYENGQPIVLVLRQD